MVPGGTPAATIPLLINLRVYVSNMHDTFSTSNDLILGIAYPTRKTDTVTNINDYRIIVYPTPCWPTAVNTISTTDFNLIGNIPNPASGQTQIAFESHVSGSYTLKITNAVGETVLNKKVAASKGMNYIPVNTSTFSSGIYIYSLNDGKNTVSKRMEINN